MWYGVGQYILEHNVARADAPPSWLRETTLFTRLFTVYAKYAHGLLCHCACIGTGGCTAVIVRV
jgi:hypothetical protein